MLCTPRFQNSVNQRRFKENRDHNLLAIKGFTATDRAKHAFARLFDLLLAAVLKITNLNGMLHN